MAAFLDACKQSSAILIPFLDILIRGKVRDVDASFILSVKGLFTLELFSDLHSIFANQYLHCVDSDRVLSCEVYAVAHHTAEKLIYPTLPTPKADNIFNSLHVNYNNNVLVTLEGSFGSQTTHTLNEKLTRHYNLQTIKDNLLKTQNCVFNKLQYSIIHQNGEDSIFSILNAFDLRSRESLDDKHKKIRQLFCMFSEDTTHDVEDEWFGFKVKLTYKKILQCSEHNLLNQFNTSYEKIVSLAMELREEQMLIDVMKQKLPQHKLWLRFLKDMGMQCPDLYDLILIMISIPPNSGWVEHAYSYPDQVCRKKEIGWMLAT